MTWPGWSDVLPWLGGAATLLAGFWALLRIFRAWMRTEARGAADDLYKRLKANDFRHLEDGLKALAERMDRMEARTAKRFEQMEARMDRSEARTAKRFDQMEARIAERFEQMEAHTTERFERMETQTAERFERMKTQIGERFDRAETRRREEAAAMEARLMAALSARPQPPAEEPEPAPHPSEQPPAGQDRPGPSKTP